MKEQSSDHNSLFLGSAADGSCAQHQRAIILAGATDRRRRGLTPAWLGGGRPKQFCRTPESDFVINQTRKQTALVFQPEKTMFVVTRSHMSYYEDVLADVSPESLIVQPEDDGSTLSVLYAALRTANAAPEAVLAFFPADFYAADVENFMARVKSAVAVARTHSNLILLGTKAEAFDAEREWIELDPVKPVSAELNVWRVRRFAHQPPRAEGQILWRRGALQNSSVTVGTAATFLREIRRAAPDIYARFVEAEAKIGASGEERALEKAFYSNYVYTDFSRDVLAKSADRLGVIPVPGSKRTAVAVKQTVSRAAPEKVIKRTQNYAVAQTGI